MLADRACQGAGATVRTPYDHHREQPEHYQQFNVITPDCELPENAPSHS